MLAIVLKAALLTSQENYIGLTKQEIAKKNKGLVDSGFLKISKQGKSNNGNDFIMYEWIYDAEATPADKFLLNEVFFFDKKSNKCFQISEVFSTWSAMKVTNYLTRNFTRDQTTKGTWYPNEAEGFYVVESLSEDKKQIVLTTYEDLEAGD
jgi:hypothetical protein